MASRELHGSIDVRSLLAPTATNDGGSPAVAILDTDGFRSVELVVKAGAITTGGFSAVVEHGDAADLADAAAVPAHQLVGEAPVFTKDPDESNTLKRVGYLGSKRYVRATPLSSNLRAEGTATLAADLAADEKVTIESVDFTFKAEPAAAGDVLLGETLEESAANLAAAINASEDEAIAGIVTASAEGAVVTVTAVTGGSAGNALTLTKTGAHITVDPADGSLGAGAEAVFVASIDAILGDPYRT